MSFNIGCDPELICRRNGQFVAAHNYFKSNSSFGLDGCESTAEIRPGFSESPVDLTSKIYQILDYGAKQVPGFTGIFCFVKNQNMHKSSTVHFLLFHLIYINKLNDDF